MTFKAEVLKVVMVKRYCRVVDVVWRQFNDMVNDVAQRFPAMLAQAAVYCFAFGNIRQATFNPCRRPVKRLCKRFGHLLLFVGNKPFALNKPHALECAFLKLACAAPCVPLIANAAFARCFREFDCIIHICSNAKGRIAAASIVFHNTNIARF